MSRKFDRILERATEPTLLEPNWLAIMDCVDAIRSAEVPANVALEAIRKRYHNDNPHVAHHALLVLEASVKNCGPKVHKVIANKDFMEDLKHLAHDSKADKVKEKLLELVQCWSHAFKNQPEFKIIVDTHNLMKLEGFDFPQLRESEAMFAGESAPEWVDSSACFRCKITFGLVTRKHHCRACGQIFCDKCSSRYMVLPHIGIEKEVRVCETCYEKFAKPVSAVSATGVQSQIVSTQPAAVGDLPNAEQKGDMSPEQIAKAKKEREAAEEEELQLAMALSQSEAEEAERKRQLVLYNLYNGPEDGVSNGTAGGPTDHQSSMGVYKGTVSTADVQPKQEVERAPAVQSVEDNELARYLNRDYWENRRKEQQHGVPPTATSRQSPTPSAPPPSTGEVAEAPESHEQALTNGHNGVTTPNDAANTDVHSDDTHNVCTNMRTQIEVFVNRIRSNQARGRSIVTDGSIQAQFVALTNLHSDVLARMEQLDQKRAHYESLQDRVTHIAEAREAVTALREEHERQRQARMLAEQQRRQVQMQMKLDVMRHKKHEMLEHQRLMALQRFQQQQAELAQRKQQVMQQQHAMYMQQQHQVDQQYVPCGQQMYAAQPPYNLNAMQMSLPPASTGYPPQSQAALPHSVAGVPPQYMPPSSVPQGAPPVYSSLPPQSVPQLAPPMYQPPHVPQQQHPHQQQHTPMPVHQQYYDANGVPHSVPPQVQTHAPQQQMYQPQQQQPPPQQHQPLQQQQQQPQQAPVQQQQAQPQAMPAGGDPAVGNLIDF